MKQQTPTEPSKSICVSMTQSLHEAGTARAKQLGYSTFSAYLQELIKEDLDNAWEDVQDFIKEEIDNA